MLAADDRLVGVVIEEEQPLPIQIGWREVSMMRIAVFRLCGHCSGLPSEEAPQSAARIKAPISPPPARKWGDHSVSVIRKSSCRASFTPSPSFSKRSRRIKTLQGSKRSTQPNLADIMHWTG
jgi:hypothetical protein